MRAVVWQAPYEIEVTEVPDPAIVDPDDAIVEVSLAAICGTDLHAYRGEIADFQRGTILGHEFVGRVAGVGSAVAEVQVGQRVLASDLVACGRCWWCLRGLHYQCVEASLFGYSTVVGRELAGGQAELVRVPNADLLLCPIPREVSDEDAILLGDIMATAYMALTESELQAGESVAVVGCGPVGLCTVMCAGLLGAAPILAVDPHPGRRARATELGATALDGAEALAEVRARTDGRGADVVVEAVGLDASLDASIKLVRARGRVVAVGAHHSTAMPFSTEDAFARELTVRFLVGNPIRVREELLGLVRAQRLSPAAIISDALPLGAARDAYRLFDGREAIKITLAP